ncbi:MAG: histidinol dehydrogenase [Nitrososphaerota archaeon]
MVKLIRANRENIEEIIAEIRRKIQISEDIYNTVNQIINDVRINGDEALIRLSKSLDGIEIVPEEIIINREALREALGKVDAKLISALKKLRKNIERVERCRLRALSQGVKFRDGYAVRLSWKPIEAVGCYAPGGRATYLSTILMTGVPGKVAGVPRMVLATPPKKNRDDEYGVMAAAYIAGFDELLWIGGAQAIAALAYGTQRIRPVRKILGPGNRYVVAAKQIVQRDIDIDFPAGPTELVVIVDETSDFKTVAYDMAAQAEHGQDSMTLAITLSEIAGEKLFRMLEELSNILDSETARKSLQSNSYVIIADDLETLCKLVDKIAPEHLVISAKSSRKILRQISNAGVVTVGKNLPSVFIDYYSGTSHVLPTGGYAATFSGLTVLDYVRTISIVSGSKKSVVNARRIMEPLIISEGLNLHLQVLRVAAGDLN